MKPNKSNADNSSGAWFIDCRVVAVWNMLSRGMAGAKIAVTPQKELDILRSYVIPNGQLARIGQLFMVNYSMFPDPFFVILSISRHLRVDTFAFEWWSDSQERRRDQMKISFLKKLADSSPETFDVFIQLQKAKGRNKRISEKWATLARTCLSTQLEE